MRKLTYIVFAIFVALFVCCKGKQVQAANDNNESNSATLELADELTNSNDSPSDVVVELKTTEPKPIDTANLREDLADYSELSRVQQRLVNDLLKLDNTSVKVLGAAKEVLIKYLKNSTAKQCDSLYKPYYSYANLILSHTYSDEYYSQVSDDFYNTYDTFDDLPPAYQPIMNELNTYGIQLEDIGEGLAELSFYPDYFYQLFKPYTTEATRKYLELIAHERANEFLFDAAICISWEELAERIASFEEVLDKYPQSMFADDIENTYNRYSYLLLMGCDNTLTCDWSQDGMLQLYPDVYEAYQRIIATHTNKRFGQTLKGWCSLFEEDNMMQTQEEANEFLSNHSLQLGYY